MNKQIIKLALTYIEDLRGALESSDDFKEDVERIEKDNFNKYTDFDYAQDIDDFMEDMSQPNLVSVAIEDKGKLRGYIFGYEFDLDVVEFDIDDEEEVDQFTFYEEKDKAYKEIKKAIASNKAMYVSNLVIDPDYRILLTKMIQKFVIKAKRAGYKYAVIETLSDSYRLFMEGSGKPNQARLAKFGLKAIVSASQYDGRDLLILAFI